MNIISIYQCQRVARRIYRELRNNEGFPSPTEKCHVVKAFMADNVEIRKKKGSTERGHYTHLQTCKNKWGCPICNHYESLIIKENLLTALNQYFQYWDDPGCTFITYTLPHKKTDSLEYLVNSQDKALLTMINPKERSGISKGYKEAMEKIKVHGYYVSRDITFGTKNGFHPHRHELYFGNWHYEKELEPVKERITELYAESLEKTGFKIPDYDSFKKVAVSVDHVNDDDKSLKRVAGYNPKATGTNWDITSELTADSHKKARNGNYSYNEILYQLSQQNTDFNVFIPMIKEYLTLMKGKRKNYPSPSLFKKLRVKEINQISYMKRLQEYDLYASIKDNDWEKIAHYNLQASILDMSKDCEKDAFCKKVKYLLNMYKDIEKPDLLKNPVINQLEMAHAA